MKKNLLKTFWVLCIALGFSFSAMAQDITVADFEGDDFGTVMDVTHFRNEAKATIVQDVSEANNNCVKIMRHNQYDGYVEFSSFPKPLNLYTNPVISLKVMAGTNGADVNATGKKINVSLTDIYGVVVSISKESITPNSIEVWSNEILFDFSSLLETTNISLINNIKISPDGGNAEDIDAVYYFDDIVAGGTPLNFTSDLDVILYQESTNNNMWGKENSKAKIGELVMDWGGKILAANHDKHYNVDDLMTVRIHNWSRHYMALESAGGADFLFIRNYIQGASNNMQFSCDYLGTMPSLEYSTDQSIWTSVSGVSSGASDWKKVTYDIGTQSSEYLYIKLVNETTAEIGIDDLKLVGGNPTFASSIAITGASEITDNSPIQLSNATLPSNASQIAYWYISDGTEFASIDEFSGELTPIGNGTVEVTAVTIDKKATIKTTHSVIISGLTTDINSIKQEDVSLYPNPVSEVLNIACDEEVTKVTIYDVAGKFVSSVLNTKQINTSELTNGVYFVKIHVANDVIVKKVIKK